MEARRGRTLERGDRHHALVLVQDALNGIGQGGSLADGCARGQVDLDGKLVTLGQRHQPHGTVRQQNDREHHREDGHAHDDAPMPEAPVDEPLIVTLDQVQEIELFLLAFLRLDGLHRLADEPVLQERHHQFGHGQRHQQDDGDRPREEPQRVVERTRGCDQEREERDRDGQCRRQDALEEVRCRQHRRVPPRHAFAQFLHVGVDDDDGVVHNHAQRDDERCQGHRVQLDVGRIEQAQRDEDGNGYRRCGDKGHAQRHEQQHHDDDRHDGDEQFL